MLAQILHDLHVPRELLDGLPEDQKQLLFCKMREEQIRRYHEREEEAALKATAYTAKKKKKHGKHVTFRLGADGNEWCWVMGEPETPLKNLSQKPTHKSNTRNDPPHLPRTSAGAQLTSSAKTGSFHPAHHDGRKQIEQVSNNIREARRLFERLECDAQRLASSHESELPQQPKSSPLPQNDLVDEMFYLEVQERAKKVEQERRETARRARDNFHRNSSQLNVCFDTENHATVFLHPPPSPLNSSNKINRETNNEKQSPIDFVGKKTPTAPYLSARDMKKETVEQEQSPLIDIEHRRSKPVLPLTREDIRQWFCLSEIPYSTFRSPSGQIYPWFHGIISRPYAEELLSSKPIGSFLIRINEKIFGYALSYRASDHCRHLLIEVLLSTAREDKRKRTHAYRFFGGARQEIFSQLNELIEKYSNTPIRSNSTDVLRYPCTQTDPRKPDYADLFPENSNDKQYESLYISLETTTSPPRSDTHL